MRVDRRLLKTLHFITDPARAAQARARLDAVTWARARTDLAAAALGGLARAIALDRQIYSGRAYRTPHEDCGKSATGAGRNLSGPGQKPPLQARSPA
jgi:hypothetical protein